MNLLTIAGSPSAQSKSAAVLLHIAQRYRGHSTHVANLNVRELPHSDLITARAESEATRSALAAVSHADALIVSTPVYKAAYAGVLKTFLDLLPTDALRGKVVLPIATGGSAAHLLTIDYALRPVLIALGASVVIEGVFIEDRHINFAANGGIQLSEEIRVRIDNALLKLEAVSDTLHHPPLAEVPKSPVPQFAVPLAAA